mgnify:CR=1 FL=1
MKTLKNYLIGGIIAGTLGFLNPNSVYSQDIENKRDNNLNFYFETMENKIEAWLCECPKEERRGTIWFYYIDTDNDKFYDRVLIKKYSSPIITEENFKYNLETKGLDYKLEFYDFSTNEKIIEKFYNNISHKEALGIGEDFVQRIKEFAETQKNFSRFNSKQLENLVRKENEHKLMIINEKLSGDSGTPAEKLLLEDEIKKIENYYSPAEKNRRREEIEKKKAILEKERIEKERIEKIERERLEIEIMKIEMKKLSKKETTIEIGAGWIKTTGSSWSPDNSKGTAGFFLEATPQINIINSKNKGIGIGFDIWTDNSVFSYNWSWYDKDEDHLSYNPPKDIIT